MKTPPLNPKAQLIRLLEMEDALGRREIYLPDIQEEDFWWAGDSHKIRMLCEESKRVTDCTACDLHKVRTQTVFGEGSASAELLLVGEAPGAEEDRAGKPFVGACGKLLDKMLAAIGLERSEVYICNALKCRPPKNRTPSEAEIKACRRYLERQIQIVQPSVILALGRASLHALIGEDAPLSKMRGVVHYYGSSRLVVTFHPGYLLRNPQDKRLAWEDLKRAAGLLGRTGRRST